MEKKRWFFFGSIGAMMLSTYIGPSFTAGTLLISFFLTKGWVGMVLGPLVCAILAAVIYYALFTFSRVYKPQHYRDRTSYIFAAFGPAVQKFMSLFHDILTVLSVLVIVSTMISTEATVLEETFGLDKTVVTLVFSLLLILLCIWGIDLIQKISSACTAIMVVLLIALVLIAIPRVSPDAMAYLALREPMTVQGGTVIGGWLIILSFVTNYQAAIDTVVPLAAELRTRRDVILMTLVSTIPCYLATAAMVFCYSSLMPGVLGMEIPCLSLLDKVFGSNLVVSMAYVLFLTLAIVTTCVNLLYVVTHRIVASLSQVKALQTIDIKLQRMSINVLVLLICMLGSSFGIMTLVNYGYMYMAEATLPFFVLSSLAAIYTIRRDQKLGKLPKPLSNASF